MGYTEDFKFVNIVPQKVMMLSIFTYVLCICPCIADCHDGYKYCTQTKDALTTVFATWSLEYCNN